jgi:hypothetical protein
METDNPLVRASDLCPLCDGLKTIGNVACWACYHAAQMKYGNPVAEARIAARETALQEEQHA